MPPLFNLFHHSSPTMPTQTRKLSPERRQPMSAERGTGSESSPERCQPLSAERGLEKRKRRSVSFLGQVVAFEYISRDDFSEEERSECFYSCAELNQIHREIDETVRCMMAGAVGNGRQWCPRGLEGRTYTGARLRCKNRRDAMQAVMEYQSLETQSGIGRNDEKIAQIYAEHTKHSTRVALLMATIDAQAAVSDDSLSTKCAPSFSPNRCLRRLNSADSPSSIVVRAA